MGSSTHDAEPGGGAVVTDPMRALQGLSQLVSSPDPPMDAIRTILSSYHFDQPQENRKRSQETDLNHGKSKKARGVDNNAEWACKVCSRSYSNKGNLQRHVKNAHAPKRRLVVTDVFECEECDYTCSTKSALDTHMGTHESSSTDKSPKYKCKFCKKQVTSIYDHYQSQHKINHPEEIVFDDGDVLVRSDFNTENGKAPWFIKEREKMELYDNVTCRLCETESFDKPEILVDMHYTMYHQVEPAMLGNLKRLFRAEKGAHLSGLNTSQTPKRKQCHTAVKEISTREQNTETHNYKANLKTQVDESKLPKVYVTIELLDKHTKDQHGPKTEQGKSVKYKCTFCHKDVAGIYKHYGNVHAIEYPEQVLFFDRGRVLVRSDLDTGGGQAPWFLREKEKAENRYTDNTCRLCEIVYDSTDLLENHYLSEHKVEADLLESLNKLRCLFRAEKGAHLADLPASRAKRQHPTTSQTSRPVSKTGSKSNEEKETVIEDGAAGLIMYQCAQCGVAATTCDAAVEHAQLHHLAGGYEPTPLTCDICNFAFEVQCIADHSTHHLTRDEYKIVKFHPSKLLDEWSEMFQGLSESHANRIKASSIYQYTRRVKMNCNEVVGIPLYQCGKCTQYVRPKDVERHCYSNTSCAEKQAPGHFCSDCERYFCTSAGLTEHEKAHKQYGNDWFKIVTFNCKEDEIISRDLLKLQGVAPIKIIENVKVSKFCPECKKCIMVSEMEAHAATHKINEDAAENESDRRIDEEPQAQNCINNKDDESSRVAAQDAAVETEGNNVEGVVEQWNSDNDSCIDVHVQKEIEDFDQSDQVEMANQNEGEIGGTGDVQVAGSEVDQVAGTGDVQVAGSEVDQVAGTGDVQVAGSEVDQVAGTGDVQVAGSEVGQVAGTGDVQVAGSEVDQVAGTGDVQVAGSEVDQVAGTGDVQVAGSEVDQVAVSSQVDGNFTFDTKELQREIQHLGFKELGVDRNSWAYIPDDLTNNLLEIVENDAVLNISSNYSDNTDKHAEENTSQDIFLNYEDVNQIANADCEMSPLISNAKTKVGDVENNINVANTTANEVTNISNVGLSGAADKENGTNTAYESVFQNDLETKTRPGARAILNRMLSDVESADPEEKQYQY